MLAADLWIPRAKRQKRPYQPRYNRDCSGELIQIDGSYHDCGLKDELLNAAYWSISMMRQVNYNIYASVKQNHLSII